MVHPFQLTQSARRTSKSVRVVDSKMSFKLKRSNVDHYSKSMPPNEFNFFVTSSDSGIDSDTSPNSSTKLANSIEAIDLEDIPIDPTSYILGKHAPDADRMDGIKQSLDWLRTELENMKLKDRELAKTMINIRSDIAKFKVELEKGDTGYDSDSECSKSPTTTTSSDDNFVKENWKLVTSDCAFPADGSYFENNKRATWVI